MKCAFTKKPRIFKTKGIRISDYGKIHLDKDEMISLVTKSKGECDITAKDWGFYLGSSLNGRLKGEGFKAALVQNEKGLLFINAVEKDKVGLFNKYLKTGQNSKVICWLDEFGNGRRKEKLTLGKIGKRVLSLEKGVSG